MNAALRSLAVFVLTATAACSHETKCLTCSTMHTPMPCKACRPSQTGNSAVCMYFYPRTGADLVWIESASGTPRGAGEASQLILEINGKTYRNVGRMHDIKTTTVLTESRFRELSSELVTKLSRADHIEGRLSGIQKQPVFVINSSPAFPSDYESCQTRTTITGE